MLETTISFKYYSTRCNDSSWFRGLRVLYKLDSKLVERSHIPITDLDEATVVGREGRAREPTDADEDIAATEEGRPGPGGDTASKGGNGQGAWRSDSPSG